MALLIHAFTLAIFALGIYVLVTNFPSFFGFVVGGLLILLAVIIRPRLGGVAGGTAILPRASAPAIYGLTDRIAAQIGARPVDLIALEPAFNASHGLVGMRRRRVLWIGLALWNVLTDEERIALLSHELAHQVDGDLTYGMVVGTSMRTLAAWHDTLRPGSPPGGSGLAAFVALAAYYLALGLYWILRKVVEAIADFEGSLLFRSSQRAEYFADRLAAGVASTAAMIECLDILFLSRTMSLSVRYAAQRDEADVWASERAFFEDVTPKEWERLRRLGARAGTSIDATHPPTNLRIALLKSGPPTPARVRMEPEESASIAAEMQSGFDLVGTAVLSRFAS